jgi:hypothetical protein
MIRTIAGIVVLILAILWLPIWLQIMLFAIAVTILPYRFFVLAPAIIGDALYAPTMQFSLTAHWLTLIVLTMLGIQWFVAKKMRVNAFYGLEA